MSSKMLTINGSKVENVLEFSLTGWLNAQTSVQAEELFNTWIDQGEKWLLGDLSELEFVSSVGLRVLLSTANKLTRKGGRIALFGLTDPVADVFMTTGMSALIAIASSHEEAQKLLFYY